MARRCRPLREERDDVAWFVTCRVVEERFWLHPLVTSGLEPSSRRARRRIAGLGRHVAKRIASMVRRANRASGPLSPKLDAESLKRIARGCVGSVVARAQEATGVRVHALMVMSSHLHMVVTTPRKNLARFMHYIDGQIARTVNRITGRRGSLWGRRYDAQPVLDDPAAETVSAYALRNPVDARLVASHDEWPGLSLAFGLGEEDELAFEWLNCTAWHGAGRPDDLGPFFEQATLELSPLPHCVTVGREAYRRLMAEWMARGGGGDGGRVAGVRRVVKRRFTERAARPKRTRRPYAFGTPANVAKERARVHVLHQLYAVVSEAWRRGDYRQEFPPGTYPPPRLRAR